MKITKDMIELTYTKGLSVIEKKSNITDASEYIKKQTGMTIGSARIYLECVIALRSKESYGGTVNGKAAEYFLSKIREDFGDTECSRAVEVMKQHVKSNSNPQGNIKEIIDKYERLLSKQVK